MNLTPTEKERLFEVCRIIWPDAGMDENGEIFVPFSVVIPGAHVSPDEARAARRPRRPSSDELPALVANAQSVIAFNGGTASRPAPKRQHIDEPSYSYGLLWGAPSAPNCPLRAVLERLGTPTKKRFGSTQKHEANERL